MNRAAAGAQGSFHGILGHVERVGNRLPDPVFLFLWLIGLLILISVIGSLAGWSALHPAQADPETGRPLLVEVTSILSPENIRLFWTDMARTFTSFPPLGYVLVVMLGAGVAERAGLFATAMRASLANVPRVLLTPAVALISMLGNLAADAAFVVLIPLAGIVYHAAGRHPIVGIAASFASVAGGYSANLVPGQFDALLLGITEASVTSTFGNIYTANIAGNWYFIATMVFLYLPIIWFITDRLIEPKFGAYSPAQAGEGSASAEARSGTSDLERKGLRRAGLALLAVTAVWLACIFGPGTPLIDEAASPEAQLTPLYQSLLAFAMLAFLLPAWAFGSATGVIRNHRDLVKMLSGAMEDMSYYLVLAFVAAHFVAMFDWSNLGLVIAVNGADVLRASGLPAWAMLGAIVLFSAVLNLFIGSASAKWAVLAPVLVPMLLLLGVSPEMTTAAYRAGDSATNMITPLMVYFPLILIFAQRWQKDFGIGSLTATMLPFGAAILVAGLGLTVGWAAFDLPLGPGAQVFMEIPVTLPAAGGP